MQTLVDSSKSQHTTQPWLHHLGFGLFGLLAVSLRGSNAEIAQLPFGIFLI
jgi:hypothetical protein